MKKQIFLILLAGFIGVTLYSQEEGEELTAAEQDYASMAIDATATQWSFHLAYYESHKNNPGEKSGMDRLFMPIELAEEGNWLKDPITGCGVWNSAPK